MMSKNKKSKGRSADNKNSGQAAKKAAPAPKAVPAVAPEAGEAPAASAESVATTTMVIERPEPEATAAVELEPAAPAQPESAAPATPEPATAVLSLPPLSKSAMKALARIKAERDAATAAPQAATGEPQPAASEPVSGVASALTERITTVVRDGVGVVRGRVEVVRDRIPYLRAKAGDATPTEVIAAKPQKGSQPTKVAHHLGVETLFTPVAAPVLAELDARNISAWFGDHKVLEQVSLTMPAGVITSLIGPSGCGKSTFLRILNRMHELIPSASLAGEVLLDGDDIYDAERRLVDARKHIGMVFQKPNPFPAMSIYDNVIAGLKLTGIKADRDRRDYLVESSLTKAGLWKEVRDRLRAPGGGLSGGQQQRLCIARSLAVAPKVLLMDEPCSALDPTSTRVIEETMLELAREVTIVIVTHNMQQAQRVSTQCAFFLATQGKPGGIVEHGSTEAMFTDPIDKRTHDYVNGVFG